MARSGLARTNDALANPWVQLAVYGTLAVRLRRTRHRDDESWTVTVGTALAATGLRVLS